MMMSTEAEAKGAVNFGKSILVPSVQELSKQNVLSIPPRYIRTDDIIDVQKHDEHSSSSLSVPVIDVERLTNGDSAELGKLHSACQDWGFFQVVNHGICTSLLKEFKVEVQNFFALSFDEKKRLWQTPDNQEGFGQLFVVSNEQMLDWSDMFYITTLPLCLRQNDLFEKLPPKLREKLEIYSSEVKTLSILILGYMAKALKINDEEMREMFDDGVQSMRMNYYPPCPEPEKAIGFSPHSDADALTILFQLNETEGLQIRKDGRWVTAKPLPNAFIVNIGDIIEIFSNGIYRSIEHRATVNSSKERLSIATFYSCKLDTNLGPAASLVTSGNPPVFRTVPVEQYFKDFFAQKLNGKSYLDLMRIYAMENSCPRTS